MQIKVQSGTDTAVVLVDGADVSVNKTAGPTYIRGLSDSESMPQRAIRGTHTKQIGRGLESNTITFGGVRKCASAEAAALWVIDFLAALPRDDKVSFIDGTQTLLLSDAKLGPIAWRRKGCNVFLDFTAIGGALTSP